MKFILLVIFAVVATASAKQKLASRATQNYFCNPILNDQIKKEFDASQTYLSLANHYAHDREALHGFSKMFKHHSAEELSHGQKLMDYVAKRGGEVITPIVSRPKNDTLWHDLTVCEVVSIVLDLEKQVTDHLLRVHECGRDKNEDPQLQDFIEGEYLNEQVDGIKEVADLLTRLERISGPNCDGSLGIYMIDQELIEKYGK